MSQETPWLVLFDADRIKGYVFATGRLKEIRGASMLVSKLTRRDRIESYLDGRKGTRLIYASGGAGKVRFPDEEQARHFQVWLEEGYRRATVSASLTSVRVPYGDEFQETVRRGGRALRRAKDAGLGLAVATAEGLDGVRSAPQPAGGPYTHFCQSCSSHPVAGLYAPRDEWLCAACLTKRRTVDALRRESRDQEDDRLSLARDGYFGQAFIEFVAGTRPDEADGWRQASLPLKLGDLGRASRPENYLGFVYADGDGVGKLLERIESEDDYQCVSHILDQATCQAACAALGEHFCPPRDPASMAPFEVAMIGGDDLILLVAAHRALEVAVTFGQEFSRRFAALAAAAGHDWRLTASLGVVLAHASQPILYLEQRAGELLRLAKKERGSEGAIDYLVVTSPTLNPVSQVRRQAYEDRHESLRRSRRPYSLGDMAALQQWARQLKFGAGASDDDRFPRNKLVALYETVFMPRDQSIFEAAHLLGRLGDEQRRLICQVARDLGFHDHFPWGKAPQPGRWAWQTALPDLVEILDFVQMPERRGP